MLALARAELRRNKRRFVAPGIAVAIAVAFVTLTLGASSAVKAYLHAAVASRATLSDVVVTPKNENGSLSTGMTGDVKAVAGVRDVEPFYAGGVKAHWSDGEDYTAVASIPDAPELRWMTIVAGRFPQTADEVVVDKSTAADLGVTTGTVLTLVSTQPGEDANPRHLRLTGVADLGANPTISGFRTLLGRPDAVASWTGRGPAEIHVLATEGTDVTALRDAIAQRLPDTVFVRTGPEQATAQAASLTGDVDIIGYGLLTFAGVSLVIAIIVIANTFSALLAGRVRALALLRCVGATRRQVFRSVLVEAGAVGTVASVAGIILGAGITAGGVAVLGSRFPSMEGVTVSIAPWTLAVPLAIGVVAAMAAAVLPARRAMRVAPLAAMRPPDARTARRTSAVRYWSGAVTLVVGTALLVVAARSGKTAVGLPLGLFAGAAALFGVLMLGPVLVPALVRLIAAVVPRRLAVRLAVGNAVRNPVRAASTSVSLLAGVSLVTMMSVGASSIEAAGADEINERNPLDIIVSAPYQGSLPAELPGRLTGVPGTARAVPVIVSAKPVAVRAAGTADRVASTTLDVAAVDDAGLDSVWRAGDLGLRPGTALVSLKTADRLGLADGERFTLAGVSFSARRAPIDGFETLVVVPGDLARITGDTTFRHLLLAASDGVAASTYRTAIREQVRDVPGARVWGAITQRAQLEEWISIALRVVIGLLAVAILIAVVGITNTMALSVLERSRELAVQRALGMTGHQLRVSLTVEALVLSAAGVLLGLVLGVGFGWAGVNALLGEVMSDLPLVVDPVRVLGAGALALGCGVLAAVAPARRAARHSPVAALAAD